MIVGGGAYRSAGGIRLPDMLNLQRLPGRTGGTPVLFCGKPITKRLDYSAFSICQPAGDVFGA